MPGIQLSPVLSAKGRMGNPRYSEIPAEDVDIERTERTIDQDTQSGFKNCALISGIGIVAIIFLMLTASYSVNVFMPAITVYQTSQKWGQDRLSLMTAYSMSQRGFNVGMVSFGNTRCSNVMKVIDAGTGYICKPPLREESAMVTVDREQTYQNIIGFGGAFTEAASINFFKLPAEVQRKVVELYWGEDGAGYTLGRVPINSCDFSPESYSFDEIDGDYDLQYFDTELTHDNAFMMPLMRLAREASKDRLKVSPNGTLTGFRGYFSII